MEEVTQDTTLGDLGLTGTAGRLAGKGGASRVTTIYTRSSDMGENESEKRRRKGGLDYNSRASGWHTRP